MEVRAGYKKTEVGVIPEDWNAVRLSELGKFKNGINKGSEAFGHGYPFVNLLDVFGVSSISSSDALGLVDTNNAEQETYDLRKGDVLFIRSSVKPSGVGLTVVIDKDLPKTVYSGFIIRFRDNGILGDGFKRHCFYAEGFRKRVIGASSVSANTNINQDNLKRLLVPIPPTKSEQEAIAGALSDVDALIESMEQLIAKKRQIKQGAMQELLTPKEGWYIEKLENIADVIDPHPSHRAPAIVANGIPFVGIGDLNENGEIVGSKLRTVDPSVFYDHLARYNLKDELIGLGRVASIGKVVKLQDIGIKYVVSPTLGVIRGTKVRRDYLLYALKSKGIAEQFNKIMSGSTRSSVGMIVLRKLDVILPLDQAEQSRIASILSDMDAEIAELDAKLAKARQVKQGMMQELLTGRIRLI
jgi:type I restriction enzyme S subunit